MQTKVINLVKVCLVGSRVELVHDREGCKLDTWLDAVDSVAQLVEGIQQE